MINPIEIGTFRWDKKYPNFNDIKNLCMGQFMEMPNLCIICTKRFQCSLLKHQKALCPPITTNQPVFFERAFLRSCGYKGVPDSVFYKVAHDNLEIVAWHAIMCVKNKAYNTIISPYAVGNKWRLLEMKFWKEV